MLRRGQESYSAEDLVDDAAADESVAGVAVAGERARGISGFRDLAAAIPGARLVVLPGAWHMPPSAAWPTIARQMRAVADTNA